MTKKKLSLVIPAYNEERTIHLILNKIKQVELMEGVEKELIIVNDCSKDATIDAVKKYMAENPDMPITLYSHEINKGKGAALHTGIQHATGDFVLIQDADLEYDPKDYPELIQLILDDRADVVYGTRLSSGKPVRAFNVLHYFGNKFLTFITNILYNTTLTDMETCYKAFRVDVIKSIHIRSNRFDFEPEITAKVLKRGYHLYEAPISYFGRDFNEGKKISWKDGIWAILALVKYRFID